MNDEEGLGVVATVVIFFIVGVFWLIQYQGQNKWAQAAQKVGAHLEAYSESAWSEYPTDYKVVYPDGYTWYIKDHPGEDPPARSIK